MSGRSIIGTDVLVKFGKHHGEKATILDTTEKDGCPAFVLRLEDGTEFIKKQKNTVRLLPTNK